jgi:hypothetical protein
MGDFEHESNGDSVPLNFTKQNVVLRTGKISVVRTGKNNLKLRRNLYLRKIKIC